MRRRHALLATAAAAAFGGGPPAQAEPTVCVDLDLEVQGEAVAESACLPPEDGGGTPELPGLPALPRTGMR